MYLYVNPLTTNSGGTFYIKKHVCRLLEYVAEGKKTHNVC